MITGAYGSGYKGAPSTSEGTWVLSSTSEALVRGLAPVALGQTADDPAHTVSSHHELNVHTMIGAF